MWVCVVPGVFVVAAADVAEQRAAELREQWQAARGADDDAQAVLVDDWPVACEAALPY